MFSDVINYTEINASGVYDSNSDWANPCVDDRYASAAAAAAWLEDVRAFSYADLDAPTGVVAYNEDGAAALAALQAIGAPSTLKKKLSTFARHQKR